MRNKILRAVSSSDRLLIEPHLIEKPMSAGSIIANPLDTIENVYFPESGIISYLVPMDDGTFVQSHIIGYDGVVGAEQAKDHKLCTSRIVVQASGTCHILSRERLRDALARSTSLRNLFGAYEQFIVADIQQTAACNAKHTVAERCSRWLLRMSDLAGDELAITQEALANMMAVRRTSVTDHMAHIASEGIIDTVRGRVRINRSKRLKAFSCECYEASQRNYSSFLHEQWPETRD